MRIKFREMKPLARKVRKRLLSCKTVLQGRSEISGHTRQIQGLYHIAQFLTGGYI